MTMRILEQYIEARLKYSEVADHQSFYVSLEELAETWYCTVRNAKRILDKMEDEGLIYWKSGGGRGKRSKLQFKRPLQEVIPPYFRMLVKQGAFKEAVRLIKRKGVPADIRQSCYAYMMKELSFPMINWSEPFRTLTPTMVATNTGRWFFVKGDK